MLDVTDRDIAYCRSSKVSMILQVGTGYIGDTISGGPKRLATSTTDLSS